MQVRAMILLMMVPCPVLTEGQFTCMAARSRSLELVPQTAHGDDVLRVRRVRFDLGTQTLDVDIQGLGVTDIVTSPHPVNQLCPGQHPAGVAQQHFCLLYTSPSPRDRTRSRMPS